jgi:protein-S-isoprenylcysteine O-methyltransferase Ste14
MALYEEFVESGHWLFRHRGVLPLVGLPLLLSQLGSVAVAGQPPAVPLAWPLACFGISLAGLALRAYTVGCAAPGTSGRNRTEQVAESLNTTGAYSLVRHPLYLANAVIWLGPVLYPHGMWHAAVLGLGFWLYYERIMFAEEDFLREKYGEAYLDWARRTPAFLPNFRGWVPPARRFSLRAVLRREYSGLLMVVLVFAGLNALEWRISFGHWHVDPFWAWALAAAALVAVALRGLRKLTPLLEDEPEGLRLERKGRPDSVGPAQTR